MRKLIASINTWAHGSSAADARDSVKQAMRILGRRQVEVDYHRFMANYHETEAGKIDPNVQWNEFALEKQAAYDHRQEELVEQRKVDTARAKLSARQQRLHKVTATN